MTNSTRMIGLIMTAALCVAAADALGQSNWDESLPGLDFPSSGTSTASGPSSSGQSVLTDSASQPFVGYQAEALGSLPHTHDDFYAHTAPIESTGTWLRRGFWYAEADAVLFNRLWNRDSKLMAAEDQQVQSPFFFSRFNPQATLTTNRVMYLDGAHPGQDTAVRGTLGNFLFRDSKNRDHTVEFTALGGGDWVQEQVVESNTPFGLFVPFYIDGENRSFDQSNRQTIAYSSTLNSFEFNYRVRQRMNRDRLVMDPNGQWHRAANAGFVREYLAGIRLVEARDILDWRAEDIQVVGNNGRYTIVADNDMIGFQLGFGLTYEASRWSLGVQSKGGVYANDALSRISLDFTADNNDDARLRMSENQLSFIGEARVLARWHLLPNFSLRAAYELMYLTSQALAPNQATFITESSYINTSQDPFFHGASFGFEGYW